MSDTPLYERVGGRDAIRAVVEKAVDNHFDNPVIRTRYEHADQSRAEMIEGATEFFCTGLRGVETYEGRHLTEVHSGMNINHEEFCAVLDDIVDAIDAKLSRTCRNHIQRLFSEAAFDLEPGARRSGDLTDYDYPQIRYEVECTAIDLSTELEEASDRNDGQDREDDWTRDDSMFDRIDDRLDNQEEESLFYDPEDEEMQIPEKYRYRHVRLVLTYHLGADEESEEKEIIVETYLPPLPKIDEGPLDGPLGGPPDSVPPNEG